MELGYWPMKGAAEAIRFLLGYLNVPFTEYNPATPEAWQEKKKTLTFDFANLPYLKDGDYYLSESSAIPLYIALKANRADVFGKDGKDQAIVRQIQGVLNDIREGLWKVLMGAVPVEKFFAADSTLVVKTNYLAKFLGEKDYFLGYLTYADIEFTYFSHFLAVYAASLDQANPVFAHANLKALSERVSSQPGIKERVEASADSAYVPAHYLKFKLLTWSEYLAKTSA